MEKFKATYETNVFGPLLVTKVMLPLLKRSAAGRIVNVSSGLGSLTQNNDPTWGFSGVKLIAYNSSKGEPKFVCVTVNLHNIWRTFRGAKNRLRFSCKNEGQSTI